MAKEGRDLVKDAVADAKAMREAAVEAAKAELIESLSPNVRSHVEKLLKEEALGEKRGVTGRADMSQRADYLSDKDKKFEEGKDKGEKPMADKDVKDLDTEALENFFPAMSEDAVDGDPMKAKGGIPSLGEGEDAMKHSDGMECEGVACKHADHHMDMDADLGDEAEGGEEKHEEDDEMKEAKDKEAKKEVEESIEISDAALREMYESALKTEATVTKGFSDMTKFGELEDVVKDADKGAADVKKGEHPWEEELPPNKQDYTVKEMLVRGLKENKALRSRLSEANKMIKELAEKLHEQNLFNAKVLHVNRILNRHGRLTREQKEVVLESIDKARSIEEVKTIYETVTRAFKAAGSTMNESARRPVGASSRAVKSGQPKQEVLRESVDRANTSNKYSRLLELAGLGKKES